MNYAKLALVALSLLYLHGCLVAAAPLVIQGSVLAVSALATEVDDQQNKNNTNATRNLEIDKTIDEFLSRRKTGNYTMTGDTPQQAAPKPGKQVTGDQVITKTVDAEPAPKAAPQSQQAPPSTAGSALAPTQPQDQETEELIQLLEELHKSGQAVSTDELIQAEKNKTKE